MALVEKGQTIILNPKEGFVVKTKILSSQDVERHPYLRKVFINICHDDQVPKPAHDFEPSIVFPLIINNQWEIPIITSREKTAKDKKGNESLVYDCCINSTCFQWIQINKDLKSILLEWCIEAVEIMYEVVLEREYTIPKMLSKGELSKTEIAKNELEGGVQEQLAELQDERKSLIDELNSDNQQNDLSGGLPDLMDVNEVKKSRKVLIEEIGDMKTNPKSKKSSGSDSFERNSKQSSNSKISIMDDSELGLKTIQTKKYEKSMQNQAPDLEKINHATQVIPNGTCIKVKLDNALELKIIYHKPKLSITTQTQSGEIDVGEIASYKTFWVQNEKKLYIFIFNQ